MKMRQPLTRVLSTWKWDNHWQGFWEHENETATDEGSRHMKMRQTLIRVLSTRKWDSHWRGFWAHENETDTDEGSEHMKMRQPLMRVLSAWKWGRHWWVCTLLFTALEKSFTLPWAGVWFLRPVLTCTGLQWSKLIYSGNPDERPPLMRGHPSFKTTASEEWNLSLFQLLRYEPLTKDYPRHF